jgi:hypothetical protein
LFGPASNFIGIMVILPIVFPEAHLADVVTSSLEKRLEAAARALVFGVSQSGFLNIHVFWTCLAQYFRPFVAERAVS